jgi:hypothetical protein
MWKHIEVKATFIGKTLEIGNSEDKIKYFEFITCICMYFLLKKNIRKEVYILCIKH